MKLIHTSDWHLGFRSFERTNGRGANQREMDVADSVHRAVDVIIEEQPDLVVIAGDVFHSVRPSNRAILHLFSELQRLRTALPRTAVAMISGNHDTPRTSEVAAILGLYRALGVQVAGLQPEAYDPLPGVHVGLAPSATVERATTLEPRAGAVNVLVAHGEAPGYGCGDFHADEVQGWHYVALGHWHVQSQVRDRIWYSGSLEYTSSDPWGELRVQQEQGIPGKGLLVVQLGADGGTCDVRFRAIAAPRRFVDLEPVQAAGMGAAAVDAAIAQRLGDPILEGAVARLQVLDLSREVQRALDHAGLRALRAPLLHLRFDVRRPADQLPTAAARAKRFAALDDVVATFLGERALPDDVDRAALVDLAASYLRDAAEDPYTGEPVV